MAELETVAGRGRMAVMMTWQDVVWLPMLHSLQQLGDYTQDLGLGLSKQNQLTLFDVLRVTYELKYNSRSITRSYQA